MKTDKLFYRIFLSQPELIAELVPGVPVCEYEYSAPVVKEKELRLDGVLTPIDPAAPVVFVEAQMQSDGEFYSRFFAGLFLYLHQYKVARPWRGLLILRRRGQELGPEVAYQMDLEQRVNRLYLEDLLTQPDLSPNLSILRLLALPDDDRDGAAIAARAILQNPPSPEEFRRRLDLVEAILVNKFHRLSPEEIRLMLDLREASVRDTRFFQDVFQEGILTGKQEGREEGREAGREEGKVDLVLRLVARRCGMLSIEVQSQIRALPIDRIEALGDALLDFTGMADLVVWLEEKGNEGEGSKGIGGKNG
jgi:predicted transposase/invertase (TIGR01784 family)